MGRNHSSLLSLMTIVLCNVQISLMILHLGSSFSPLCHLHDNATSQLHQKILLLMKSNYTGLSSNKPFSVKPVLWTTVKLPLCLVLPIYLNEVSAFPVLPLSTRKQWIQVKEKCTEPPYSYSSRDCTYLWHIFSITMCTVKDKKTFRLTYTAKIDRQSLVALERDFLKYLTGSNNYLILKSRKVWQLCLWVSLHLIIQILLEIQFAHELSCYFSWLSAQDAIWSSSWYSVNLKLTGSNRKKPEI